MKQTLKASLLIVSFLTTCLVLPLNVCAQSQPTFVYTNDNTTSNTVTAFSVSTNGALTQIGVFPTGGTGGTTGYFVSNRVVVGSVGNFLFASNDISNDVSVFSIAPMTGLLSFVGRFPTGGSGSPGISLAATPDGKFLMAGNAGSNNITVFSISANGVLAPVVGSPFPAGGPPDGMKISPNGLFLATGLVGPVDVLSIGSNGALTPVSGSPFQGSGADNGIDIRCSGNQLFAGNFFSNATPTIVDVFSLPLSGALTPIPGSPFHGVGIGSAGVLLSPNNQFLFVSNTNGDSITVFNVATNGFLTVVGSPFPVNSGGFPALMATNQAGTFLFTANASLTTNPPSIGVFSVALNGSLAAVGPVVPVPGSRLSAIAVFPGSTCSNPVPQISQPLVPSAAAAGGSGFTLTINGTGFVSSSVVNWNGTALPTTVVNGNQLTATVPASNIAVDGTASVTVTNPAPGGATSNVAFFTITTPTTSISLASSLVGVGIFPVVPIVADFNKDGVQDLAIVNCGDPQCAGTGPGTVSILLGNGDGTFSTKPSLSVGVLPNSAVVGDFNRDGNLDLAVASLRGLEVSILLGNGDGTFQAAPPVALNFGPSTVLTGDFNGDGNLDLAVTDPVKRVVSIWLGNGDGTFTHFFDAPLGGVTGSSTNAVGDFNGDGILDIAMTETNGTLTILLGNGDGSFIQSALPQVGATPTSVRTGDFNGDGKLDLAVANQSDNTISVLLGKGDGTFQSQVTYPTGLGPTTIAVGDLNGDNILDLAVSNSVDGTVTIFLGQGNGTFQAAVTNPTGTQPYRLTIGDFNGDGRLDLAVANAGDNTVSVLLQSPTVSVNPTSLDFGNQLVNTTSAPQALLVTNTGTAPLTMSAIAITGVNGSDFSQTDNCGASLPPSASCNIQVAFTPAAAGARNATVSITDNAPGSPQTVPLSGTGTPPGLAAPTITTQPVGETVNAGQTATLSVVATGSQPLSYQWYLGQSGDTSAPVSSATNSSFTTPALTSTVLYWVQVANGVPPVANSSTATIIVSAPPVMTQPAPPVIAGLSSSLSQSLTAPPASVNPLVTFVCTTVSGPNGNQQASDVGITCTSLPVTLSSTPQNVTITINTTGSTLGFLSPLKRRIPYALTLAVPGLVFLGMGASGRRSSRRRLLPHLVLGLVCILVVLSFSCGGGFTPPAPPQQRATPAGSYNITVISQPVLVTPTGFVQTSLIVPLQVAPAP